MRSLLVRMGLVGSMALAFGAGCVTEEDTPRFWRIPREGGHDAVLYLASGRAYLVAFGRVYTYDALLAESRPELGRAGVWREVPVGELPEGVTGEEAEEDMGLAR